MQVDRLYTCGFLVLMFKIYGIIGISKIELFNFFGTERYMVILFFCLTNVCLILSAFIFYE